MFCPSECELSLFPDTNVCTPCKSTCNDGCRNDDTCRLCREKECNSCDSFSGDCITCITNADKGIGNTCVCNENALWVDLSESCDLCYSTCASCTDFTFTGCVDCFSGHYKIGNICNDFCPSGYATNINQCDEVNAFVFNLKPNKITDTVTDSQSSIIFNSGSTTAFYPTYSLDDTFAARYKGYYFRGSSYMKTQNAAPYLNFAPVFTIST